MRESITSVFEEFIRSIGANITSPEIIHLEIENNFVFTAEGVNDDEVVMSVVNKESRNSVEVYELALDLCRLESRTKFPIRVGLLNGNQMILSLRMSAERLDISKFHSGLRKLILCHNRISGVVVL